MSDTDLFLTNGFKSIYARSLVERIVEWFSERFIVVYRSNDIRLVKKYTDPKEYTLYVEKTLTDAAKAFGITGNALGYKPGNDGEDDVLYTMVKDKLLPAESFESYGTMRFVNEFPLVLLALSKGATLVMDEFDASIHPMAVMNILSIFHNNDYNTNKAQLIFNTHNPIFLDSSQLRRDEIKFIERDEHTGNSIHYALSDFKTADGIRKDEDYMSNYFVNRYGAIRDVDFYPLLDEVMMKKRMQNEKYDQG